MVWCYAGYPLWIALHARFWPHAVRFTTRGSLPRVTAIVAARNERSVIERRVQNLLGQTYPADRLNVVVVCNGSDDGTEEIARQLAASDPRIQVLVSASNLGKAGAVNLGVAQSDADIIVFADARQTFAPDAVARLVEPFGDSAIGVVSGNLVIRRTDLASVEGVRKYWGMEMWLRDAESRSGSVVQALGAIYAVRRALFQPVPANLILDDIYVPLCIAMSGYRVVMASDALGYDVPAVDQRAEFARKRRTMVGNIQFIRVMPRALSPIHNPLFFRFVSHKLLRLLSPFCFLGVLFLSAVLPGPFYQTVFLAGLGGYLLGGIGLLVKAPLLSIPAAFILVHAAIFAAVWRWREDASKVWMPAGSPLSKST